MTVVSRFLGLSVNEEHYRIFSKFAFLHPIVVHPPLAPFEENKFSRSNFFLKERSNFRGVI